MSFGAIAHEVSHGQLNGLIGFVLGSKVPLPLPSSTRNVAIGVADQQIELAIAEKIGEGQPDGFRRHSVGCRRQEPALTISGVDSHTHRRRGRPSRRSPLPVKSTATRTIPLPVNPGVRTIVPFPANEVGLANQRPPRVNPEHVHHRIRAGIERLPGSVGPPGVSTPAATPAVASRLETSRRVAGIDLRDNQSQR